LMNDPEKLWKIVKIDKKWIILIDYDFNQNFDEWTE